METVISCLVNGASFGALLFIFSSALTIILGLMGVVNLAHGSFYLLGAFVGLSVSKATGNFFLALLAGGIAVGFIALIIERIFIRFLYNQENEQVLLTFALIYIFDDVFRSVWGPDVYSISGPEVAKGAIDFIGITTPTYRLMLIGFALAMFIGLWFFQEKTRYGAIIRAGVEDKEMVGGLGINVPLVFLLVFSLGSFLAGLSGVLGGPFVAVYSGLDLEVLVYALMIIVIGGVGSLIGSLIASLLLGVTINFSGAYFPGFGMFVMFVVMVLVLILRPTGLFGRTS
jgi:branched-chain amino acid transport system permease protein